MTSIAVSPGIGPVQATAPWQSGRYYFVPNITETATSSILANAAMRALPFYVPNAITLSRIGAEITNVGDAGCTVRLGIYSDNGTGRPGSLVIDAGTIAGDSVAVQEIVISQALGAGIFWAAGTIQGVTVTQPTVRCHGPGAVIGIDNGTLIPGAAAVDAGASVAGITGAFPATFGATATTSATNPRIFVKVA